MGLYGTLIRVAVYALAIPVIAAFFSVMLGQIAAEMPAGVMKTWFTTVGDNALEIGLLSLLIQLIAVGVRIGKIGGGG